MPTGSELPVVLLMGPTGAGKSAAAIALAARLPAEIVSVDSTLVYRGLDIGTAKPDATVRAQVPHHLIDILDPAQPYSAGQFLRDALAAIQAIHARGRVPLLTGGTMLYFHALLHGLAELPEADTDLRRELDERAARGGTAALHAELERVDAQAAARIHPNDPQRIQRALEVFYLTGQPISELQASQHAPLAGLRSVMIVLSPARRAVLHQRIEERFLSMMAAGFLEEVRALRERGDFNAQTPAMRAVGYRQLWAHLDGAYSLEEAVRRGIVATRRLAKRQLTWLRALPGARWIEPADDTAVDLVAGLVKLSSGPNAS